MFARTLLIAWTASAALVPLALASPAPAELEFVGPPLPDDPAGPTTGEGAGSTDPSDATGPAEPEGAAPQEGEPLDPEAAWAIVEQQVLPAWEARAETARRQVEARRAWLEGSGAFAAAWPELAADPLNRRQVLQGRLVLLDERGVARARERGAAPPAGAVGGRRARWRDQRAATLDAEDTADELERRLVLGLLGSLDLHPQLTEERLRMRMLPWTERVRVAGDLSSDAPPDRARELAADAARASREVQRTERLVRQLQRSAVGPGPVPSPDEEIARVLASLERGEGDGAAAAVRLEILESFLDEDGRAAVAPVLEQWFGGARLKAAREALEAAKAAAAEAPPSGSPTAAFTHQLELRRAELAAVQAELDDLVAEGVAASSTRRRAVEIEVEARRVALEAAERRVAVVRSAGGAAASSEAVRQAHEDAMRAAEEAEAAVATAAGARERRRADVLSAVARATDRAATLREQLAEAEQRAKRDRDEVGEQLASVEGKLQAIRTLSAFAEDRPDPDAVYRDLRNLTMSLRTSPAARGEHLLQAQQVRHAVRRRVAADRLSIEDARELVTETEEPEARTRLARAVSDWEAVLRQEAELAEELVGNATVERDAVLRVLQGTREARRGLAPWISGAERVRDRGYLLEDVGRELALLGPSVVTMVRGRFQALLQAPFKLLDFNVIRGIVVGSFWTFVMVGAWFWARDQVAVAATRITDRIEALRPEMRSSDVAALHDPVARFLRAFVDLMLGYLLVGRVGDLIPEVGFVLLVYLQVALYRALLAFFDLVVVRLSEVRPALVALRDREFVLARTTVRVLLTYMIARRFILYLLWEVLALDVITRLIASGITLVGLGLLGVALHAWEPSLRRRIARRDQGHRAIAWLTRDEGSPALRVARSVGILGFFAIALFVDLFYLVARERSSMGRLFNAVSRYRLSSDEEADRARVSEPLARRIAVERTPAEIRIARPEVLPPIQKAFAYWREHRRLGMAALVGDRGSGKRTACDQIEALLATEGVEVTRVHLDRRLITERDMLDWLAGIAGLPPAEDADALVDALEALPPRAFVLEGMHRAWSRRVAGFSALTTLLYVLNATSEEHFWVVSIHQLSWDFVSSIGSFVDMGIIRTVVRLEPLTASQLRELTVARTEAVGLTVDFQGLAKPSALGGDPSVDLERAVNLFYRLLSEASDGNPKVALHLWTRCLEPDPDDPSRVRVHLASALSTGVVNHLSDAALFALVALRIQDELDEEELSAVTNIPRGLVRSTVRDLIARGLLGRLADQVRIPDGQLPAVTRTLRRRHFLHLEA